jgi:hypothetical protein
MVLAHVAGIPVEETLLGFAPVALTCLGLAVAWLRNAVSRRPARRGAGGRGGGPPPPPPRRKSKSPPPDALRASTSPASGRGED